MIRLKSSRGVFMRLRAPLVVLFVTSTGLFAQEPAPTPPATQEPAAEPAVQDKGQPQGWRKTDTSKPGEFVVTPGTKVPLALINSVSTKHSVEGDRVYLETVFPIMVNGRIVIPPGSYVAGTVTQVKRPGRGKGRGELFLRFGSLTLATGVARAFPARVGALGGRASEEVCPTGGQI